MPDQEITLRAIELMRAKAQEIAMRDYEQIKRNGHTGVAESKLHAAKYIGEVCAHDILALATAEKQYNKSEAEAFEAEGRRLGFEVTRDEDGELFHPISKRAWQIWRAAVRWAQTQQ